MASCWSIPSIRRPDCSAQRPARTAPQSRGRSFAADPLGRFVVTGQGKQTGSLEVTSAAGAQGTFTIGPAFFRKKYSLRRANTSYVTLFAGNNSVVHIYILDTTTWELSEAPSSPLPGFTSIANFVADPTGPFVYESTAPNQVRVVFGGSLHGIFCRSHQFAFLRARVWVCRWRSAWTRARSSRSVGPCSRRSRRRICSLGSVPGGYAERRAKHPALQYGRSGAQRKRHRDQSRESMPASSANRILRRAFRTGSRHVFLHSIFIIFTPAAAGHASGYLRSSTTRPGSPQVVALSGTGVVRASYGPGDHICSRT